MLVRITKAGGSVTYVDADSVQQFRADKTVRIYSAGSAYIDHSIGPGKSTVDVFDGGESIGTFRDGEHIS